MKKFLSIIGLILTFFIIYFLQANFFTWFHIAGVKPNLFIVLILFIGLFMGNKLGFVFGLLLGIYIDLVIGKAVGISGIMLGIVGIVGEYLDKNFSKDSRVTMILMVAGSTAIYEVGQYIFQILRWNIPIELLPFIKILLIEVIFNVVLVIILYSLIQKVGNCLEGLFKSKSVLTRYF
ncbi:MAG: rod shape-determining protein MreD [Clostridia bacterium]|nr:rod shape-determining protein MreD [Clostridia bacterium]